ncbi:hypothetical protein GGTG_03591 [Gaeumannomyces tritici R3-111a-1]|uniref:Uncharacterized protein n=1 Tax=Gaeumannomyces tritici (strain R3-111a-1) TaxID=644352 RepID=J3NQN5_GAET3|nr:hypothetical protein GGTG_03591 [Gaeumannomyces tritici R3-111a-1]EJT78491.1 hypothetical protein GGTG_03591 [Gaeumannomyces tritici R3-111a-1]
MELYLKSLDHARFFHPAPHFVNRVKAADPLVVYDSESQYSPEGGPATGRGRSACASLPPTTPAALFETVEPAETDGTALKDDGERPPRPTALPSEDDGGERAPRPGSPASTWPAARRAAACPLQDVIA